MPSVRAIQRTNGFADLPDRGNLVGYPTRRDVRHDGAYTWHRAEFSEAHALQAVGGVMHITTPAGDRVQAKYERHVEHPSGDWTWVGRVVGGAASDEVVLTFGERAAFGTIAQPGQPPLKLTMSEGRTWLIETDPAKVALINNSATRPLKPDFKIPPKIKTASGVAMESSPAAGSPPSASAQAAATTTVDLLLGYTSGFAAALGGQSQAITRLNNLVEITNQAYANSQLTSRVRLVHAMEVNYSDGTSNDSTLEALTGFRAPSTRTTPDPAFAALRAARNQYGADLVSLVRKFNTPEHDGCGIAWLIGGGQTGIQSSDEYFGYSVVSDGRDAGTDGKTYFCREETLAHELGHNMGSQHDRATATVDGNLKFGIYPYSFGYKTGGDAGNFYTVMAYGDSGQTSFRTFSNPRSTFCNGPCGIENQADNARSLSQTHPLVAQFRATVVADAPRRPDIYAISKLGGSGRTELHVLTGGSVYQSFSLHLASALHQTGSDGSWAMLLGDYNRDGVQDLYTLAKNGSSGRTEVHVLDGASGYSSFLTHAATALHQTGSDSRWLFKLGNFNGDGILDVYAINRTGASGRTEVHVLNGADNYQTFLAHIGTALQATGTDQSWAFELGDYDRNGSADLYVILKSGQSGTTEIHVLNGTDRFQTFLANRASALASTPADNSWEFKLGDYNGDSVLDVYALAKMGGSGTTEVHVLDGASQFASFSAHLGTALQRTGTDESWEFELGPGS